MQKTENVSLKRTPLWYLFMLLSPITGHTASNPFQSAATGLLADCAARVNFGSCGFRYWRVVGNAAQVLVFWSNSRGIARLRRTANS